MLGLRARWRLAIVSNDKYSAPRSKFHIGRILFARLTYFLFGGKESIFSSK